MTWLNSIYAFYVVPPSILNTQGHELSSLWTIQCNIHPSNSIFKNVPHNLHISIFFHYLFPTISPLIDRAKLRKTHNRPFSLSQTKVLRKTKLEMLEMSLIRRLKRLLLSPSSLPHEHSMMINIIILIVVIAHYHHHVHLVKTFFPPHEILGLMGLFVNVCVLSDELHTLYDKIYTSGFFVIYSIK